LIFIIETQHRISHILPYSSQTKLQNGDQEHYNPRGMPTHPSCLTPPSINTHITARRERRKRHHNRTPQRRTPLHHHRHHALNVNLQTTSYHHTSHCRLHVFLLAPSRVPEPRRSSKLHHRWSYALRAIQTHHRRRGRCRRQALLRQRIRWRNHPRGVQKVTGSFCWR